jgi:hypothetical protein
MANLDIAIPHNLPQQEALTRIQGLLGQLRKEQAGTISDVNETWNGNEGDFSFSAKGFDLSGKITVEENKVSINSQLPFALSFFKGKISQVIREKAGELLSSP